MSEVRCRRCCDKKNMTELAYRSGIALDTVKVTHAEAHRKLDVANAIKLLKVCRRQWRSMPKPMASQCDIVLADLARGADIYDET